MEIWSRWILAGHCARSTKVPSFDLALRIGPSLVIGNETKFKVPIDRNITVEVVKIQGNRISLGIVASFNVKILRGELTQPQSKAQIVELVVEDGLLAAC